MSEKEPVKCGRCGAAMPPESPEGLCPRCLMEANLATETGEVGPQGTIIVKPPAEPPPPPEEIARLFPQLEIHECLGRGGMGAVYKARQPKLERFVALKILARDKQNDPKFTERFMREAQALARLNHPNIVTVHDFGETDGHFYLIMEFVDGLNLRQLLQTGKLQPEEAITIVPPICEALQFAHEHGIVHRDIKPENILVDRNGRVKIADFGIAKLVGGEADRTNLTADQQVIGTPHYMAPEQVEKPQEVDHRADIYSLGVVFYEMLTRELPLGKFAPPSKKVQVDVRLDNVVLRALEKEPERRYQQASQVKTDLETIAGTPPPPPIPPRPAAAGAAPPPGGTTPPPFSGQPAPAGAPARGGPMIAIPAVGLVVAGVLKIASAIMVIQFFSGHSNWLHDIIGSDAEHFPFNSPFVPFGNSWFGWTAGIYKMIPAALMVYGGIQMVQMRSYAWSIAAAILGIIACSLLGFPMGIWALIVLCRADVRAAFGQSATTTTQNTQTRPPANWSWVWPAVGILAALLVFVLILTVLTEA